MTANDIPEPPTPADCDLQDFPFMPLHVARLRDSDLAAQEDPEACWYAVLLWSASWHQIPAASLPDDDAILARLCGLGRDLKTFRKHRSGALRGFIKCSDGRLYHPVVVEQAMSAWEEKAAYRERKEARRKAGSNGAKAKWEKTNSDHMTRSQRLAVAREKGKHTKEQWAELVVFCRDSCVRCGEMGEVVKDHITPIYKGGSDAIENLQPLCPSCNSSKGPEEIDHRPDGWQLAMERLAKRLDDEDGTPSKPNVERLAKGTGTGTGTNKNKDKKNNLSIVSKKDPPPPDMTLALLPAEQPGIETGKACVLPNDWTLPSDWKRWTIEQFPHWPPGAIDDQAARFGDYWHGLSGARARKRDWPGTWRNWCRKANDDYRKSNFAGRSRPSHVDVIGAAAASAANRIRAGG